MKVRTVSNILVLFMVFLQFILFHDTIFNKS